MKIFLLNVILFTMNSLTAQISFNCDDNLKQWAVVNDDVMGGVSKSNLVLNNDCNALFSGKVSLDNNGGFASVRYFFDQPFKITDNGKIILRIKGDGKSYQFRIKLNDKEYFSYISSFLTTGQWEDVELPISAFYPSFRGRKLANAEDVDLSGEIAYIAVLIANKKAEDFNLEIKQVTFN
jgi:NADH dehydrogenase [ubiquinone] 1 alpha subcomplex assembly factor 1